MSRATPKNWSPNDQISQPLALLKGRRSPSLSAVRWGSVGQTHSHTPILQNSKNRRSHPAPIGPSKRSPKAARQQGVALVIVIVLIAISLTLFGVWAKSIVSEHRRLANQQMRFQAVRLAEAGLLRGQALLAADAEYDGETWQIPAEALGGPHAAAVRISITRRASADGTQIQATAEYPLGSLHRAQVTKRINMPQPFSEDES